MTAAVNPYWQQATWAIDPANATGLASDGNTGVDATAPLLTWGELLARWGTSSPHLRQNTTITWLSSQAANNDPVTFTPYAEAGAVVSMVGQLAAAQQIATGVLSNVTAKNRATPQILLSQSGATAVGQLIVNTQAGKASRAWTYKVSAGSIFQTSQPLVSPATPVTSPQPAEVDTWANGDSVTVYAPIQINLALLAPQLVNYNAGVSNFVVIQNLSFRSGTSTFDPVGIQRGPVYFVECQFLGTLDMVLDAAALGASFINCDFGNVTRIWSSMGQQGVEISGGQSRNGSFQVSGTATISGDFICFGGFLSSGQNSTYGNIYIDTGRTLAVLGGGVWQPNAGYGNAIIWGPGTLNVGGTARFQYRAGAGVAAATFLQTGGFTLNGQTTAWLVVASAAPTANKTLSVANLDTDLGAASGAYTNPAGATLVNTGNAL